MALPTAARLTLANHCVYGLNDSGGADLTKTDDMGAVRSFSAMKAAAFPTIVLAALAWIMASGATGSKSLTLFYVLHQDRWLLTASAIILLIASAWKLRRPAPLPASRSILNAVAVAMAVAAFVGHYAILSGHDVSRDEQMASFDATVFASGQLFARLPTLWRDHADALNTIFMYPADHRAGWISSYLPMNALLRAGFGQLGNPYLAGALWTLLGAVALWNIVRRIWPEKPEAATVALLLYLGSGQILITGMTAYAMPAHLALNLVWLSAYLRRSWPGDIAALAVGFVAIGLHQPLMHPMFAAPVLFLLVLERSWGRAGFYAVGYALAGLFWLYWPNVAWQMLQAGPDAVRPAGVDYVTRLTETVKQNGMIGIPLMEANLLRFFAWQHLLLPALLVLGLPVLRRDRLAAALGAGCLLTFMVMLIILPYQGHGFGYRYLHGLIGNAILLAVYGWNSIDREKDRWRGLMTVTTVATLCVLAPIQLSMAHAFYRPWADVSHRIDRVDADYAVIGDHDVSFARDLVLNAPDLGNRPIRLVREAIRPDLVRSLCASKPRIAFVGAQTLAPIAHYFGETGSRSAGQDSAILARSMQRAGCRITVAE